MEYFFPALLGATLALASPPDVSSDDKQSRSPSAEVSLPTVPPRLTEPPIASAKPLSAAEDLLSKARREGGRWLLGTGESAKVLTLRARLQEQLTQILRNYRTPYASVVALEPRTGRVLAMAEHSEQKPSFRGLAVKAIFPAASIFKLVTATALLEGGVSPEDSACFWGGKRRISERQLQDSKRDHCMTLSEALAKSANAAFAKLTARHLTAETLSHWAEAFHFNLPFSFPVPTEPSLAAFPEDPVALAQTGAGFGDVYLSPLHGAAIAATVANGGLWRDPVLFENETNPLDAQPARVLSEERAAQLASMMEETVSKGTARRVFRERGFRVTGAVGKTGSLADRNPFRDYSWFVGYAPKDDPKVAVGAVIVNDAQWRIRAPWLAREAMRLYLEEQTRAEVGLRASSP